MSNIPVDDLPKCCGLVPVVRSYLCDCGCEKNVFEISCPNVHLHRRAFTLEKAIKFWKEAPRNETAD